MFIQLLVLAAGCAKSPGAVEQSPATGSPAHHEEQDQQGTDGMPAHPMPMPGAPAGGPAMLPEAGEPDGPTSSADEAIEKLRDAATTARGEVPFGHAELAASLRSLADVVRAIPEGANTADAASRIESFADRVDAAGETSDLQSRWAKRALTEAADALAAWQSVSERANVEARLARTRTLIANIVDDRPFSDQRAAYGDALDAYADAVAATRQVEPSTR